LTCNPQLEVSDWRHPHPGLAQPPHPTAGRASSIPSPTTEPEKDGPAPKSLGLGELVSAAESCSAACQLALGSDDGRCHVNASEMKGRGSDKRGGAGIRGTEDCVGYGQYTLIPRTLLKAYLRQGHDRCHRPCRNTTMDARHPVRLAWEAPHTGSRYWAFTRKMTHLMRRASRHRYTASEWLKPRGWHHTGWHMS
jgi:hypothetical protein